MQSRLGFFFSGFSPAGPAAFGIEAAAIKCPASFGLFDHYFPFSAVRTIHIFDLFLDFAGVFTFRKGAAAVKLAESSRADYDLALLALWAFFSG